MIRLMNSNRLVHTDSQKHKKGEIKKQHIKSSCIVFTYAGKHRSITKITAKSYTDGSSE